MKASDLVCLVQPPMLGGSRSHPHTRPPVTRGSRSRPPNRPLASIADESRSPVQPSAIKDGGIFASHLTTGSRRWWISTTCMATGIWRWRAARSDCCYARGADGDLSVRDEEGRVAAPWRKRSRQVSTIHAPS